MGGLAQQVNLYRGNTGGAAADKRVRLLLVTGVGAVLSVVLLAGAGEYYLSQVQARRDAVAEKLRSQQDAVAQYRDSTAAPKVDPFLKSELAALHRLNDRLNANLAAVAQKRNARKESFSAFFDGLARNTLDGLWFSSVGLSAGGSEVLLKGKTTQASLVPRLLQTLANEKAFAGRTFRNVSFTRAGDRIDGLVEFELRSAHAGEIDDAG